jgi:hypothetical protein
VRRLLLRERLYGIKIGTIWAIFPDDLAAFKRSRRPPGRPRVLTLDARNEASAKGMASERKRAGTARLLRKRRPARA